MSGVAAVELALLIPLMVILLSALGNLGLAFQAKIQVNNALSSAAYYVFQKGQGLTPGQMPRFDAGIRTAITSMLPTLGTFTIDIEYNGSKSPSKIGEYYCIQQDKTPVFIGTGSRQSRCSDEVSSGKYVMIKVSGLIDFILPSIDFFGENIAVSDFVYIRIE